MIEKKDLEHCAYYVGSCRGASVAKWDRKRDHFIHINYSCGGYFLDTIKHPDDEHHYDVFVPIRKIDTYLTDIELEKVREAKK